MKQKEIYYYEDLPGNQVIIGRRGGTEYRVNLSEFMREILRARIDTLDKETQYEFALKVAIRLSQYVNFEEVKPNIILSGIENHSTETNETK